MKKSNEPTKTKSKMKKTIKFLSMAALAMVGAMTAGCSSDDNIISQPQQPENQTNVVTLTTTVGFDEATAGTTRTLAIDYGAKTLKKTFAVGDQIAVVYENTGGTMVKAESVALTAENITAEGKSATFTVTLTDPKASGTVKYIYPAAMAGETDVDYTKLNSQDGTLATIASKYDLAVYDGSLTGDATLPASPTLTNGLAIIAYTIKDNAATPNDLTSTITGMTISDGTNNYTVTRSAAAGPIYVAIQPTSGANIEYTATDGTKNYIKSVTSKTYAAGEFYQLGLRMTEKTLAYATTEDIGKVVGINGRIYASVSTAKSAGTTACAIIAYVGTETGDATYPHGLAIALDDAMKSSGDSPNYIAWSNQTSQESNPQRSTEVATQLGYKESGRSLSSSRNNSTSWPSFYHALNNAIASNVNYSTSVPSTGTSGWFLPSLYQWNKIVNGLTGTTADFTSTTNDAFKASNFNTKFTSVGGVGLNTGSHYWSSSEYSATNAWFYSARDGNAGSNGKVCTYRIRAVFAF